MTVVSRITVSSFDFLAINAVSETLKKTPTEAVLVWLVRYDAELALSTVTSR